jgi:hypothetical protein
VFEINEHHECDWTDECDAHDEAERALVAQVIDGDNGGCGHLHSYL